MAEIIDNQNLIAVCKWAVFGFVAILMRLEGISLFWILSGIFIFNWCLKPENSKWLEEKITKIPKTLKWGFWIILFAVCVLQMLSK